MKHFIILLLISVTYQIGFSQTDSLDQKILRLMELNGTHQELELSIKSKMAAQKDLFLKSLGEDFFQQMQKEMETLHFSETNEKMIAVYNNHFTEKEIDELILFYESPLGKKIAEKQTFLLEESLKIGNEISKKIGQEMAAKVMASDEYLMNVEVEGCEQFKNGKFETDIPGTDDTAIIERSGGFQLERSGMIQAKFKVEWLSPCQYALEIVDATDPSILNFYKDNQLISNIYEITDTGYKFISQVEGIDMVMKGEMKQLKTEVQEEERD